MGKRRRKGPSVYGPPVGADQRAAWKAELTRQDRTSRGRRPGRDTRPDLAGLARLMRERAGLPPAPVPPPLHRMAADRGRLPSRTRD